MRATKRSAVLLVCILAGFATFGARACEPLDSAPAYLADGVYCLSTDVDVINQPAFQLGDDAVLDCQGHRVSFHEQDPLPDLWWPWTIYITGSNSAVRNCVIDGGYAGVFAAGNHVRIQGNTIQGSRKWAIYADRVSDLLVERNLIHAGAGAGRSGLVRTTGVVDILDNVIFDLDGSADTEDGARYGIWMQMNTGGVVARNILRNVTPAPGSAGAAIATSNGLPLLYRNVMSAGPGDGADAILCWYDSCIRQDNIAVGYAGTD